MTIFVKEFRRILDVTHIIIYILRGEEESHSGEVLLFTKRRVITQLLIVVGTIIAARYFLTPSKETFVSVVEHVRHKAMDVPCSKDYSEELNKFKGKVFVMF